MNGNLLLDNTDMEKIKKQSKIAAFGNNKFIVINRKHLEGVDTTVLVAFYHLLGAVNKGHTHNKYYVCNQDEPYADDIITAILEGEEWKLQCQREKA
jgi:hypothetical protein